MFCTIFKITRVYWFIELNPKTLFSIFSLKNKIYFCISLPLGNYYGLYSMEANKSAEKRNLVIFGLFAHPAHLTTPLGWNAQNTHRGSYLLLFCLLILCLCTMLYIYVLYWDKEECRRKCWFTLCLIFLEKRKNSDLTLFNICGTVILATECTSLEFSNDGWVWKYVKSNMNFTLSRDKKSSCLYHTTQLLLFIASVLHLQSAMKSLSHLLSFGMVFCPAA